MSARASAASEREVVLEQVRVSLGELLGAERRLRGRDQNRHGELTIAQLRALWALGRGEELSAGQLARQADLNPASMTAMLDQLEQASVVRRRRSTKDRRVCFVSLTSRGAAILEEKRARYHEAWAARCANLSDAELAAAVRVMGSIAEMYDSW